MNRKRYVSALFILAFIVLATISCNVGLGESIDTEPPSVEILDPSEDAVLRMRTEEDGETGRTMANIPIVMRGTCSDDKGMRSIEIVLRDTKIFNAKESIGNADVSEPRAVTYNGMYNFTAVISEDAKTWECRIDPKDSVKTIPDGAYEATVTATDTSGRQTKRTKFFAIDSTRSACF